MTDKHPASLQEQVLLYNVDVTCSRYLSRPEVLRAAHFAAMAHEGQVCALQITASTTV